MTFRCSRIFVTLAAPQVETLAHFYSELFGKKPIVHIPNVYVEFELSGLVLGIFKPKESHQSEFAAGSSGGMSLCLDVDDLEAAIAHLNHLGYPPPGEITSASHGKEIYAYDPAGNRLILHQKISA